MPGQTKVSFHATTCNIVGCKLFRLPVVDHSDATCGTMLQRCSVKFDFGMNRYCISRIQFATLFHCRMYTSVVVFVFRLFVCFFPKNAGQKVKK